VGPRRVYPRREAGGPAPSGRRYARNQIEKKPWRENSRQHKSPPKSPPPIRDSSSQIRNTPAPHKLHSPDPRRPSDRNGRHGQPREDGAGAQVSDLVRRPPPFLPLFTGALHLDLSPSVLRSIHFLVHLD
jgi:hypothetical protein